MSEDSIASESTISCRTEACAPLLPPRKRLLAGLKQNGWCSPSSSSCAIPSVEDHQIPETLPQTAFPKHEACHEVEDRASLQSHPCPATEPADSHQKNQRKSKRQGTCLKEKCSKEQRSSSGPKRSPFAEEAKSLADAKDSSVVEKLKDEEGMDATVMAARHTLANVKEADVGAESVAPNVGLRAAINPASTAKEYVGSEEVCKSTGKPANKSEDEGDYVALKPRKGSSRQEQSRNKSGQHKKQDILQERSSQNPPFLSDEEFARQLHRVMNSSPRISRCQSLKEEKLLVAANRKHYPGG